MYDLWVQDKKTGEAWRLDHDESKKVYIDADGNQVYKCDYADVRFYPCCPKEKPKFEIKEETGEQFNIFDYMKGAEDAKEV